MKKTLIGSLVLLSSVMLFAQQNAVDKYFSDYLDNPAFDQFIVTEKSFDLIGTIETDDPDEQTLLDALDNIQGVRVLDNENTTISLEYYEEAVGKLIPDEAYQDLVIVEESGDRVHLFIRENESTIQEFVAVVASDDQFVIASIFGKIDLSSLTSLSRLGKKGGANWMKNFSNLEGEELIFTNSSNTNVKSSTSTTSLNDLSINIFPNPASEYLQIGTESGVDAKVEVAFYSISGKAIQNVGRVSLPHRVAIKNLPTGTFFLRLTDEEGMFRNFKIVKQ
ncbi:MAG: DUF4252 domain-containing protein [Bacteroidota bacterium]